MSRSWAKGSTGRWRKIRAQVLLRDGYLCQIKMADVCTLKATQVHHTKGRSVTGDDPRYLVASCMPCNLKVGDPTQGRHDPEPRPTSKW